MGRAGNGLALIYFRQFVALDTPTEWKQRSMKGELLRVECEPLEQALDVLQSAPEILDAAVFGNALPLAAPMAEPAIPAPRGFISVVNHFRKR